MHVDVDPEALHSGEPTEAEGGAGIGIDTDTAAAAREHYLDVGCVDVLLSITSLSPLQQHFPFPIHFTLPS